MVSKDRDKWDAYCVASEAIYKRVYERLKIAGYQEPLLDYSAYKTDDNDVPLDNLDEVAVKGRVYIIADRNEFYGGIESKDYRSWELINPTWLDVCVCAEAAIRATNDHHHVFLEGLDLVGEEEGIKVYKLCMGS